MIAKNLERLLAELCRDGDVSVSSRDEFENRFASLRGYGRIPRGRDNRARPLTDIEIASTILGITPIEPGWAGHAAAILTQLVPVGGVDNAFAGAAALPAAIVKILSDPAARQSFVALRISTAEGGTNSHGYASIVFDGAGDRRLTSYVRPEAVSLLHPGAEHSFDTERRHAPFAREVAFNRRFFDRLADRVRRDRAFPPLPAGDGSEYDAEEAEQARRLRLGATPSSRFLHVGVDNHVTWPKEETLITFDRYKLVLLPKTKDHVQSVHIDLHDNRVTSDEAMTIINRLLSMLSWCDDHFAIAQDGWSGNSVPVSVPKRDLAFTTTHQWLFNRNIPASDEARRALALYREARNAEQNFMVSYAVLNYYKIIEIHHKGWKASTAWVAQNLSAILNDPNDRHGVEAFVAACGTEAPELYIYGACRVAVAHVSNNRLSDPDEAPELRRLHNASDIMRRLARRFIKLELAVSDDPF